MQLRCYRCGWSFAIKKEEIAFALTALQESGGNHYDVRCSRCRHMNRVSLQQLQKFAPKAAAAQPAGGTDDNQAAEESGEEHAVEGGKEQTGG